MSHDQISKMVDAMEKETETIREEAIKMAWFMRGGLSYDQALRLSSSERQAVGNLIRENMETTKKSGLPFF